MEMHDRISQRRRMLNITQEKLAKIAGVSLKTVSRWETGERMPKGENLRELAAALDTSAAYLLGETDNPGRLHASLETMTEPRESDTETSLESIGEASRPPGELQASQDLDSLIRELASIDPDLIVNFRTTRKHWKDISPQTKERIAQGMKFVLGLAELSEEDGFRTPKSDEDL